jgi:uncharacterized protein (UPF0332 family)
MSFSWKDYLALAKTLRDGDEASKRSAISRAYYAAFCYARDRLKSSGIPVPTTGAAHERVAELYGYSSDFDSLEIKKTLTREKIVRNSADYDNVFSSGENLAASTARSIQRAQKLIERVDNMPEKIIDEIRAKM